MDPGKPVLHLIVFALLALCPGPGPSYSEEKPARKTEITPELDKSIKASLEYLARTQRDDGSWSCRIGYKLNYDYIETGYGPHVGVTALAGMTFMANGHLPGRGKYGNNVKKAVDFIVSCIDPNTGFVSRDLSRMYSHAFASLFLAEIYGMTHRADLKEKLKLIVNLLVSCQNKFGGWRYLPFSTESDISITVCQLQFLRAARNCGIAVPPATIARAIGYVKACHLKHSGGFTYQFERPGSRSTFALTAAGITALHSSGVYFDDDIRRGLFFLTRNRPRRDEGSNDFHYFYGHYYAIQAFYQEGGDFWAQWWPQIRDELIASQKKDGSWLDEVGPTYATAMAALILSIPLEILPIFQR